MQFTGYASLTEVSYDMGHYSEVVARGAFSKSLSERPDVQMLINHGEGGSGMPIARTGRNMTLDEDSRGLRVDADLDPEDSDVQLLARKMSGGLIDQMSFAFRAERQSWSDDYSARRILEANIHRGDVSVVNQGASPTTSATIIDGVRSAAVAAGGRSMRPERKALAEALGAAVVLEMRNITLGGRDYDLRASSLSGLTVARSATPSPVALDVATIAANEAAEYRLSTRSKYTQREIDKLGKQGKAFGPDAKGHFSYPCADQEDLRRAIRAVGRGSASHNTIRKWLIGRAKLMGLSSLIPSNWASDGSLTSGGRSAITAPATAGSLHMRIMEENFRDRRRLEALQKQAKANH
jgi:HK97 family phage prohead protease